MVRQTRVEIDAAAITNNLKILKSWTGKDSFFCPMVKANGYGHGDTFVARIVEDSGVPDALGVALYEEGARLRQAGIRSQILVFAAINADAVKAVHDFELTPVAGRFEDLEALKNEHLALHLKFNTGMNRLGFDEADLPKLKDFLKGHPGLKVEGVCTHLSHGGEAHTPDGFTQRQLSRFRAMTEGLPGVRHAYKSASLVSLHEHAKPVDPEVGARPGLSIYGLPDGELLGEGIKPALKWSTELIRFHNVAKGEAVGYGARWIAPQSSVIGIVPVGYGDGYMRALSNKGKMLYRGARVPVVGSVCMDYTLIDLTAQVQGQPPRAGEEIVILGKQNGAEMSASELAAAAGTITYEIVTAISARVPREVI